MRSNIAGVARCKVSSRSNNQRTGRVPDSAGGRRALLNYTGMRLSPNFTLAQFTRSETATRLGLPNRPGTEHIANLRRLATSLEQVRRLLGHRLVISSGFRAPALNAAVGGAPSSRHALGLAADFTCPRHGSALEASHAIVDSGIEFDLLIYEYGRWVHFQLSPLGIEPRRQVLTICNANDGYKDGLTACD